MLYYVARLTEDGTWVGIRSTHDYDHAETLYDYFCEQYPNAYLDILDFDEMHNKELQLAMAM